MNRNYETIAAELDGWTQLLTYVVPLPTKLTSGKKYRFTYVEKSREQAILLRMTRIVSTLHAMHLLNSRGYFQEQAALQRMHDEYTEDVEFLAQCAKVNGQVTDLEKQYLAGFFDDQLTWEWDSSKKLKGRNMPNRDKIRNFLVKSLEGQVNQSIAINAGAAVSHGYSAFVHGYAAPTMEMYVPDPPHFRTSGMLGSSAQIDHDRDLQNYVLRTVQAFVMASATLNVKEVFDSSFSIFREINGA